MNTQWISSEEAQARLGIKPQTLYAYTSRGLIANRADANDPRRSVYSAEDVQRLTLRKLRGRRASVAREALTFSGEAVLTSALTAISGGKLYYRGEDAVGWAQTATLEDTARLLWACDEDPFASLAPHPNVPSGPDSRTRAFAVLAQRAAGDSAASGRAERALKREAASLLADLVDAMAGASRSGPMHERLARAWRVEGEKADVIRRAIVLTADHELNASTFAARVAASTGASLGASALAGLSTLSGPLHGGMTMRVAAFVAEVRRVSDPKAAAMHRLAQGLDVPGFGHPLYPQGDPRSKAIQAACRYSEEMRAIAEAGEAVTGAPPNLDFALVCMCRTLGLPHDAPFTLFTVGRMVGWLAHALEQRISGDGIIRPRARYVGPTPAA